MDDIQITIIEDDISFRDPKLTPGLFKTWGRPTETDARVICASRVFMAVEARARDQQREIGGVLLGEAYRHEGFLYIEIVECIFAEEKSREQSSSVHFDFTPAIWAEMLRVKDQNYEHLRILGWFHSHPGHGIFLSPGMDDRIQKEFFHQPWQTAMVFDPVRHEGGFFVWQAGRIVQAPGFYERFDPDRRRSVVSWRNLRQLSSGPSVSGQPTVQSMSGAHGGRPLWFVVTLTVLFLLLLGLTNLNIERATRNLSGLVNANGSRLDNLGMDVKRTAETMATEAVTQRRTIEALTTFVVSAQNAQATQVVVVSTLQVQIATSEAMLVMLSAPTSTTTPTATSTVTPTATPTATSTVTPTATPEASTTTPTTSFATNTPGSLLAPTALMTVAVNQGTSTPEVSLEMRTPTATATP